MTSAWQPPAELPDLRRVGLVAIDAETNDEGLRAERGSAWPWHGGYVCGISIAYRADSGIRAHYLPIRHPDTDNFDPAQVFRWLKDLVASGARFVTQNGLYDWGWLRTDGGVLMPPSDRLEEIGAAATLIDENRYSYSLDSLCAWRGLPGKDETVLQEVVRTAGLAVSKRKKINVQEHIYQLPARYVGPYAERDVISTLALWESLNPILDQEGTRDAYRLEVDLLPMVLAMRRRGIRIDQAAAEHARDIILQKRDAALAELSGHLGTAVGMGEIAGRKWLERTFDAHKIKYPRTKKGNPSFTAGKSGWMIAHPHWLPQLIARANKYDAAGSKFLEGHILGHIIDGRIHSEIHPHRSDEGGTRSLRFSYSDPPLQQMPSRDKELAPLIRGVFLPEEGEVWAKPDISQQEFRILVHYAVQRNLPGSKKIAELYRNNPDTDIHAVVSEMTGRERELAKAINYANIFGAGPKKLAEMIGKSLPETEKIVAQYNRALPFVAQLSRIVQSEAKRLGYTELYDGARRHWNRWEARGVFAKGAGPCSFEEAKRRSLDPGHPWFDQWLGVHKLHTAMNALIQGSAARHTKLWMRACWREGIVPLLQMHDALDCSVATREQGEPVARLGCEAVQLAVPMRVDLKFGRTWGDASHSWDELHNHPTSETTTQTESLQPQVGFSIPGEANKRTSGLPTGSESDHNLGAAENDAIGVKHIDDAELPPWPSTPEPAHTCAQCRLDPPDGNERPTAYNGLWLHTHCEDAFIRTRIAEEGLVERAAPTPSEQPPPPPPPPKEDDPPLNPPGGNGYAGNSKAADDGYASPKHEGGKLEATFVFVDAGDHPHSRTLKWRHPDGRKGFSQEFCVNGRWVKEKPAGWVNLPYRLSRLIKAVPGVPIFNCEGEKDADTLTALGLIATTNSEGAGKWTEEHAKWFTGKQTVYILEDNDDAGRAHARKVATTLQDIVPNLHIISFPDLAEREDVSDWLAQGHTREELLTRAKAAPKWQPPLLPWINMSDWDDVPVPEQEWAVADRIPLRQTTYYTGEGAAGKSIELQHLCVAHALAQTWLDSLPEPGPSFYIEAEDDDKVIHYRLAAIADHYDVKFSDIVAGGFKAMSFAGKDSVLAVAGRNGRIEPTPLYKQLLEAAGDIKPKMVGIASSANVYAGSENDRSQVQQFVGLLTRIAIVANGAVVLAGHPSLTGINTDTGLSGTTQWHNAVRARFYMKGVKPEDGEQPDTDLREIVFKKNQYGRLPDHVLVRWQGGLFLPVEGINIDQVAREAKAEEVFLELLRRFTAENQFVSTKPSVSYAPTVFAKEDASKKAGVNKTDLAAAMRRLFATKKIWNEPYGKPSRPSYRIALAWKVAGG